MTSRIPAERASRFLKWFNFNPVSMEIRWRYYLRGRHEHPHEQWLASLRLRGGRGYECVREQWLAYLTTLDLVTVRHFLHILWNEIAVRHYIRYLNRHVGQV